MLIANLGGHTPHNLFAGQIMCRAVFCDANPLERMFRACYGAAFAPRIASHSLQAIQPMVPILTALYTILKSTAMACASDPSMAPLFSSQEATTASDITHCADRQLEAIGTLCGARVDELEGLALVNMAAFVFPSPANLMEASRKAMEAIGPEVRCSVCQWRRSIV
jgi:hypothetical protein